MVSVKGFLMLSSLFGDYKLFFLDSAVWKFHFYLEP